MFLDQTVVGQNQTLDLTSEPSAPVLNPIVINSDVFVAPNSVEDIEVKKEMLQQQLNKIRESRSKEKQNGSRQDEHPKSSNRSRSNSSCKSASLTKAQQKKAQQEQRVLEKAAKINAAREEQNAEWERMNAHARAASLQNKRFRDQSADSNQENKSPNADGQASKSSRTSSVSNDTSFATSGTF